MPRGDSWVILVGKDILTPEPVWKLQEKEDQSSESKLMPCEADTTIMEQYDHPKHDQISP